MAKPVELYTTAGCPYSAAAREDLEWRGIDFVEYDVEQDREAYERMLELTGGNRTVPVLAYYDLRPRPFYPGERLQNRRLLVEPVVLGRRLEHRVFAAHVVDG